VSSSGTFAVLADVHGNAWALREVLALEKPEAETQRIEVMA